MVTETFTAGEDFTVPPGVFSLTLELEGEAGGASQAPGGAGGRVAGALRVAPGDVIAVRASAGGAGGAFEFGSAGAGGDSIDLRVGGTALENRLAVAAGGGGGGQGDADNVDGVGGAGGADTGEAGTDNVVSAGGGGTQTGGGAGAGGGEDGAFGTGGAGEGSGTSGAAGGGGAGWYGGGGGEASIDRGAGGGGGSNYDDGLNTVTANERGTSTRTFGQGGLVTITYEQTPGAANLQITNTTATSNTLSWDAPTLPPEVDSIDQYRIYRSTDPGTTRADYTEVGTTPTPGFEDSGLDNGTEYHYRVGADLFVPEPVGTITITDFRGV